MFLPSSSVSVKPTEEDAEKCYTFANNMERGKFYHQSFEEGVKRHYENFRIERVSSGFTVMVAFGSINFSNTLYASLSKYDDIWLMRIVQMVRVIICCVGIYTNYKIFYGRVKPNTTASREEFGNYVSTVTSLSNFIIIAFALVNGVAYAWRSSLGSCLVDGEAIELRKNNDYFSFDCNAGYEMGGTPGDSLLILLVGNLFLIATLRCHYYWAAFVSYVVTIVSVIVAAAVSPAPLTSSLIVLCSLYLISMYNDMENNSLTMFNALLALESTNRVKTTELKQFIGNVAHDLKVRLL